MIKNISFLVVSTLFLSSCYKLQVPNEEAKRIFGSWQFHSSTGGLSGQGAQGLTQEHWISYSEKGKYTLNKNDKQLEKSKFRYETRNSIMGGERTMIIYHVASFSTQSFTVSGDTLYLVDEMYDGFDYKFVRK